MNGYISFFKPRGMTSSRAVVLLRKRLPRGVKIGHAGTLDPDAQGVLPIMIGKATRFFDYIVDKDKTYRCKLCLGKKTDTQDDSGEIVASAPADISSATLAAVLPRFIGDIQQIPPVYSALKVDGQPMYKLAREGKAVAKPARSVHVENIEMLERLAGDAFTLRIYCGKGTYIRTICNDIGDVLGCYGHMADLWREKAGIFTLENALGEEDLPDAEAIEKNLIALDAPLMALPRLDMDEKWEKRLRAGNLEKEWLDAAGEGIYRLYMGSLFCGLIRISADKARFAVHAMERGE